MISQRVRYLAVASLLLSGALTGCKTTSTTVVDASTGRPLPGTRVTQSDGSVKYTDAQGNVMRKPDTTATVSRDGYRAVDVGQ